MQVSERIYLLSKYPSITTSLMIKYTSFVFYSSEFRNWTSEIAMIRAGYFWIHLIRPANTHWNFFVAWHSSNSSQGGHNGQSWHFFFLAHHCNAVIYFTPFHFLQGAAWKATVVLPKVFFTQTSWYISPITLLLHKYNCTLNKHFSSFSKSIFLVCVMGDNGQRLSQLLHT